MAANIIILVFLAYAAAGLGIAIAFALYGVRRIDEAAAGAPWTFRLIILPGAAALWPIVLKKWLVAKRRDKE